MKDPEARRLAVLAIYLAIVAGVLAALVVVWLAFLLLT